MIEKGNNPNSDKTKDYGMPERGMQAQITELSNPMISKRKKKELKERAK